eukprot:SAG11_NODE_88_length_17244_cov_17.187460_4_plen_100_part_00
MTCFSFSMLKSVSIHICFNNESFYLRVSLTQTLFLQKVPVSSFWVSGHPPSKTRMACKHIPKFDKIMNTTVSYNSRQTKGSTHTCVLARSLCINLRKKS